MKMDNLKMQGIPEERFYEPLAVGPCGDKQHKNFIKLRKNGNVKQFEVDQQKTLKNMIDQFDQNEEKQNKESKYKNKYVAVVKDSKKQDILILTNKTAIQLYNQGLNDIELQQAYNQKGQWKYPKIPEYNPIQNYFPQPLPKILSKIQSVNISVKLIYQRMGFQDKCAIVNVKSSDTILQLKKKATDAFGITHIENIILEDEFTMKFSSDKRTLQEQKIKNNQEVMVRVVEQIVKNHTHVVNGVIVNNMTILIYYPGTNKTFSIDAAPSELIQTIIKKVAFETLLKEDQFNLIYMNKELIPTKSLTDYNIGKKDKLHINLKKKEIPKQIKHLKQPLKQPLNPIKSGSVIRWLVIKSHQQILKLNYQNEKNKTVWKLISQINKTYPKYFSLLHGNIFLNPTSKINQIQKHKDFESSLQIVCFLVQSAQKKLFYDQILVQDWRQIVQNYKIPERKDEMIKKFRTRQFNRTISDQIFRFDPSDQDSIGQNFQQSLRQVVLGFMSIQKYINPIQIHKIKVQNKPYDAKVLEYDLYKRQRFYGFHTSYKAGQHLYFKQFLQTKKKNYKDVLDSKSVEQTVFMLRSISGRDLGRINANEEQEEVVFMPYTYFTVDNIIVDNLQKPTCEYIFLTQMQTLFSYKNTFLLWVDDDPNNASNKKIYQEVKSQNQNLQIMKLISTKQAQGWMMQFAWLMNWQDIRFKIISDMTRYEIRHWQVNKELNSLKQEEQVDIVQKASAAIDLIQVSCDQLGFTTLITIFCMNKQNAIDRVTQRDLKRGLNYHEIIGKQKNLKQNINKFLEGVEEE